MALGSPPKRVHRCLLHYRIDLDKSVVHGEFLLRRSPQNHMLSVCLMALSHAQSSFSVLGAPDTSRKARPLVPLALLLQG